MYPGYHFKWSYIKNDVEVLLAAAGVGIVNQNSKENREPEMLLSISHTYTVIPQDVVLAS